MLSKTKDIPALVVTEQVHALLKEEADKNERTLSGQVRFILNEWAVKSINNKKLSIIKEKN